MAKSQKILSLCAVQPTDTHNGYIIYRFGTAQKIELEYPKDKTGSFAQFTYSTYFRGGGKQNAGLNLMSVYFTNDDIQYEVFSNSSAEDEKINYGVTVHSETDVTLECRQSVVDNIHFSKIPIDWLFTKIKKY
jgi:hypothetical protein